MHRLILVLICLLMPGLAQALSCARPDFARSFDEFHAAPERYWLVYGTIAPAAPLPEVKAKDGAEEAVFTAPFHLDGQRLTGHGLSGRMSTAIKVEVGCWLEWCGGFPDLPQKTLMFLREDADGLVLSIGPCGGPFHHGATRAQVDVMDRCISKGACGARDGKAFRAAGAR